MSRAETPHRRVDALMSGDFLRDARYVNWRPHGSGDWLLIYTAAGAGAVTIEGRTHLIEARSAVLFSPGAAQDYATESSAGRWRLLWVHFMPRPHWLEWLRWPEVARGVSILSLAPTAIAGHFQSALMRTISQMRHRRPEMDFALNSLEEALLWGRAAYSGENWLRADPRVVKAVNYLAANLKEPFRLGALSRQSGLSISRLSHLFKAETGLTPQNYSEELRMQQAKQLLSHTNLHIKEVASEVGFADPYYFSRRFRSFTGMTATRYRSGK